MTKNFIDLDGLVIEVHRKPIKNIHLRIYPPDGQVKVSAPLRLRLDLIHNHLKTKRDWIHAQHARFKAQPYSPPQAYIAGEQHYFLGKNYTLAIHQGTNPLKIAIDDQQIHLHLKSDTSFATKHKLLENWYRQQMKEYLPVLISKWETKIGVNVHNWGVRAMKTRWGSCNPMERRIWLNLHLIKKSLACLEYVVVHEMIHLLEASHNKRFYALMDHFLPHWRDLQKQLEEHPPASLPRHCER